MKKSTIGMILLVAMVLTKAMLPEDSESVYELFGRSETLDVNYSEFSELRTSYPFVSENEPKSNLLAVLNTSQASGLSVEMYTNQPTQDLILNSVENNDQNLSSISETDLAQIEDFVIPMENGSNTGYGLWKSTSEEIISKGDRIGEVPLDNGNTVMTNVSTLFPRTH